MIVPTTPGQQVQVQPIGPAYSQVPETTQAPVLGAVAQAAQQFGTEAEKQARLLQARQTQSHIWDFSAEARAKADEQTATFATLGDEARMTAGKGLVDDFQKWAEERAATMEPNEREIARQYAGDVAVGLDRDFTLGGIESSKKVAAASLANGIQRQTRSAFGIAVAGGLAFAPAMTAGPNDSERLDEKPLEERWNAIASMIDDWSKSHPGNTATAASMKEQARGEFDASVIEGLLTPVPGKPIDWRAAQAYYRDHKPALDQKDVEQLGNAVDNAVEVGTVTTKSADAFTRFAGETGSWGDRSDKMDKWITANVAEPYQAKTRSTKNVMIEAAKKREDADLDAAVTDAKNALDGGAPASQVLGTVAFARLPAERKDAIRKYVNARAAGEFSVTNDKVYDAVDRGLRDDPQAFTEADIDARVMGDLLSQRDGEAFKKRIANAEKLKGTLTPEQIVTQRADEIYTTNILGVESDEVAAQRGKLKRAANAAIAGYERVYAKEPDYKTTSDILDSLILDSFYGHGDKGAAVNIIPPEEIQMAYQQFIHDNGRLPSPDDLRAFWLESQASGG